MKAAHGLVSLVTSFAFVLGTGILVCGSQVFADADSAAEQQYLQREETFEGYLYGLERESGRLEAEKGLRELELFLHEEIVKRQLELKRLEQEIAAARRASSEVRQPLVEEVAVRPRPEMVPRREEAEKEFVSILPAGMPPARGQVLIAAVQLKRGKVKEVRVLDEDAHSIYAELPLGRISIPKQEIEALRSFSLSEEEYRFKLADYYDNVPASRWYYRAMVQYNRVLDLNPDNKSAQEKLKKCQEELDAILERERKQTIRNPQRPIQTVEPPGNEQVVRSERVRNDLSQDLPAPHHPRPMIAVHCPTPHPAWFARPRRFSAVPPFVPLDVNCSILMVPVL